MYQKHEIGKWGEETACKYLTEKKYEIIERNFTCSQGEIDIITWDKTKKELVFIEVKTRTNRHYGEPIDAVNMPKQKHIYWAAQYYVYLHQIKETDLRFDVIEIYVKDNRTNIRHIKQIF